MSDLTIPVVISRKRIRDLITGAGSRYWARDLEWGQGLAFTLTEHNDSRDPAEHVHHEVSEARIVAGLATMAQKYPSHFADCLPEGNDDMWTGDALLQCAIFGQLKYG